MRKAYLGALMGMTGLAFASGLNAQTVEELKLIDDGFQVFTEETFDGNGRTCSTCHIPGNQYNIFPNDIRKLRGKALELVTLEHTVPGLENPTAVRKRALFNTEGHGLPPAADALDCNDGECEGVILRGSMNIGALALTTRSVGAPGLPSPALGWAANGSPGGFLHHGFIDPAADGSIRAFAAGAVAQHFPKTLARIPAKDALPGQEPDFRLATDAELDQMEAFQVWLGRREEFSLVPMVFRDKRAQAGKSIYMSNEASCNVCHRNAGSQFSGGPQGAPGAVNINQHSDVNEEAERLSEIIGVHLPEDPGITVFPPTGGGGPEAFNIQPVIEAVGKEAFFHNHAIINPVKGGYNKHHRKHKRKHHHIDPLLAIEAGGGIEGATTFYFREPFVGSEIHGALQGLLAGGGPDGSGNTHIDTLADFKSKFGDHAINVMGAFLRSLSAFYSLRDCERLIEETIVRINLAKTGADVRTDLAAMHCEFNLDEAIEVLDGAKVHALHRKVIHRAYRLKHKLYKAVVRGNTKSLKRILSRIQKLRAKIATTPDLS